jgi:hypothetical protein
MASFKGKTPEKCLDGNSDPSARLRAQPAILYYRGLRKGVPVGNGRGDPSIDGAGWVQAQGLASGTRLAVTRGAAGKTAHRPVRVEEPARCSFEFFRRLGTPGKKLGCHRRNFGVRHLGDDFRVAIEDSGQSHKDERSTSRTLYGAIANAIAVLTKIRRRQGDVVHSGECHWPTS